MDISVVIPSKDGLPLLKNQLKSLSEQQTEACWEVIVSDNGSADGTAAVVEEISALFPVPLKVVNSSDYPGVGGARNVGIKEAHGRYIAFCDADDEADQGWIESIYLSSEQYDVVGGPLHRLDTQGRGEPLGRNSVYELKRGGVGFVGCNVAIRKDLLIQLGGFDFSLPRYGGEDSELAIRLNKHGVTYECNPKMIMFFRETKGMKAKIKKIHNSNLAEVHIWKKYPNDFPRMNSQFWVINVIIDSMNNFVSCIRAKNPVASIRYAIKPLASLVYAVKNRTDDSLPKLIHDMK